MYTFEDRNGDSLTLRPEGTKLRARRKRARLIVQPAATPVVHGAVFRHERPQKGRYR